MASEPLSSSGKMGGLEVSNDCGLCDNPTPVKYCAECNVQLCQSCTKAHGKLKATLDHPLLDTGIVRSDPGGANKGLRYCSKHADQALDLYCKTCMEIVCDECRKDHGSHTIVSLKDDLKLYQTISTQRIKTLLDKTKKLEEYRVLIDGVFFNYDEAIYTVMQWEKELINIVRNCSNELVQDLHKAKDAWCGISSIEDKGVATVVKEVEEVISKLNDNRKVTDVDIFSHELDVSQKLLNKVNNFIENVLPQLTLPQVDDILPERSRYSEVKRSIVDLMTSSQGETKTMTTISLGSLNTLEHAMTGKANADPHTPGTTSETPPVLPTRRETSNLKTGTLCLQSELDIPDPDSHLGYRINQSYFDKTHLMIHGCERNDIRIFDLVNKTFERHVSECNAWNIASIDPHEYVVAWDSRLYLLSYRFGVVEIRASQTGIGAMDVAYLSRKRFAVLQVELSNKQHIAHIHIAYIKDDRFYIEEKSTMRVRERLRFVVVDKDKEHAFACGSKHLYKINLKDWTSQHLDLTSCIQQACCLCIAGDDILVCDSKGEVQKFDKDLNFLNVLVKIPTPVRDLAIVNGDLVVTTQSNKILLYKHK